MELVNKPYGKAFFEYAAQHPEVLCLSADLTSSCEVDGFRDRYPEQFVSCGMAEQNMLSFAGGLAMEGFRPFIHTFGVFLYRRPLDQLINSIAYPNRRVRLMGFLPGITTPGGITHQATDDIGILRTIPNMTILETGDATEVETVLPVADAIDGPVYVRVLRGQVPRLFDTPFQFNTLRHLSMGHRLLIVSAGVTTEEVMRATPVLKARGVEVQHVHVSTLKPFPRRDFVDCLAACFGGVITVENHSVIGGLGSIVAEIMAEIGVRTPLLRLGLQDRFAHGASKPYLMRQLEFDAMAVVEAAEIVVKHKLGITPEDLAAVRVEAVHSTAKAEAL